MKNIQLTFLLMLGSLLFFSCSSDDAETTSTDGKGETPSKYRLSKIDLNNARSQPYSYDDFEFTYEADNETIKEITRGSYVYELLYEENLITVNLVEENMSGAEVTDLHEIHLENNKVTYVKNINVFTYTSGDVQTTIDSIKYDYHNNRLAKISSYRKNDLNYELVKDVEMVYQAGNVIETNTSRGEKTIKHIYTYDTNEKLKFSQMAYEMPIFKFTPLYYTIAHDKFGEQNKNNVLSASITYDYELFSPEYSQINYTYVLGEETNLLERIELSGTAKVDNPDYEEYYPSKTFDDISVMLIHESY